MNHGTVTAYNYHLCRCRPCTDAHAEHMRERRARARQGTTATPTAKPQPRFAHDLTNLRNAMTLEEWRAREAADPDCRPVTQDPIQRRSSEPVQPDRASLIDLYVAGES